MQSIFEAYVMFDDDRTEDILYMMNLKNVSISYLSYYPVSTTHLATSPYHPAYVVSVAWAVVVCGRVTRSDMWL